MSAFSLFIEGGGENGAGGICGAWETGGAGCVGGTVDAGSWANGLLTALEHSSNRLFLSGSPSGGDVWIGVLDPVASSFSISKVVKWVEFMPMLSELELL